MLTGTKILIGVTASIAAYKSIVLVRLLVKAGAEVKVILTPKAADFVSPLTLSTLSKNDVITELFDENTWANHVMLGRWADVFIIAPLSCNTLAKMSAGLCDNLLMATYLSATCPVIAAPAMDEDMWHHPATKNNIQTILSFGNRIIRVENGELASGLIGDGRMAEPEHIVKYIQDFFFYKQRLKGKTAVVTAGPTFEAIDPVRFIGNHSSGKMGVAIAETLYDNGADVTLVLGPSSIKIKPGIKIKKVVSADEMYEAVKHLFHADIIVMSAAVADYKPKFKSESKIKKTGTELNLQLERTIDILEAAGTVKKPDQILVGFALETNDEKQNAKIKLQKKNADLIVLNSLNDAGAGFGGSTNKITIFDRNGNETVFETKSKTEVASDIVNAIINFRNA
ncbi:bifunctional phosphopantothenoylcysteine decarboxylase/phosphopantothenate--cysteine ligase CoaBC [soil metagenome]